MDIKKLDWLNNAYVIKQVDDERKEIKVINNELTDEQKSLIKSVQFALNDETGSFELDYEIMDSACTILAEQEDLENADFYELSNDSSNPYTAVRLGYINIFNQEEISQKLKEYDCDIQQAAAIWFEEKVAFACELLKKALTIK